MSTEGAELWREGHNRLEEEQRKATLKTLQEDAETPADKVAAIQAVYHKDPSVLKQHVENLTRRLTGQPTQPVVSPQEAQQGRLAPLVARGKTPDQQALEFNEKQGDTANQQSLAQAQQKQKQTFDLIDTYIKDPEQNKQAKEDYVRKQAGIASTVKNLPGAAGQPFEYPPGSGRYVRPVQGAEGIVNQPMPEGWKPPAPKASKPLYKIIRGHAVLIDTNTGKITHDLGAAASARTTTRDVPITDADGNVHIEKMTTVSVPGMGDVSVDAAPGGEEAKGPAPRAHTHPSTAGQQPTDRTLPFRKSTPQSTTAKKAVDTAQNSYLDVQKAGANGLDPVGSQGVVLSWLRGRVNRVTASEISSVRNLGGIFQKFDGNVSSLTQGTMTPEQYQWFLRSAKDNYDNAQTIASKYNNPAPKGGQPGSGNVIVISPEDMK